LLNAVGRPLSSTSQSGGSWLLARLPENAGAAIRWNMDLGGSVDEQGPVYEPARRRECVEAGIAALGEGAAPMQSKRIWTLIALAGLAAITVVRPEDDLAARADARPSGEKAAGATRSPATVAPRSGGGAAWLLLRTEWSAVLWRVYQKMNDNRLLAVAAGVVFYGLLAVFPAITAFVSLYGLMADPSAIHERLSLATGVLPQGALDILNEQLTRLTSHRSSALSLGFVGGLLVALWSANAGVKAIMDALNVAYGETEKRGFVILNLVALAFTVGAILALILALSAVVIAPILLSHFGLSGAAQTLMSFARWPILLGLVVLGLTMLYRFAPSLSHPHWTWLFPGNVIAAISWLVLSAIFSWYIAHFGNYDATYGSLGAAIGMMTWMWISMIVVLLGAELNAEIQRAADAAPLHP
jgi:membrane protein